MGLRYTHPIPSALLLLLPHPFLPYPFPPGVGGTALMIFILSR